MTALGTILLSAIQILNLIMWGRLILDWVRVLVPGFRPKGALLVIAELIYTVTDPPLKLVRRVVKPVQVGPVALDIAWIVVILLLAVLSFAVRLFFFA